MKGLEKESEKNNSNYFKNMYFVMILLLQWTDQIIILLFLSIKSIIWNDSTLESESASHYLS